MCRLPEIHKLEFLWFLLSACAILRIKLCQKWPAGCWNLLDRGWRDSLKDIWTYRHRERDKYERMKNAFFRIHCTFNQQSHHGTNRIPLYYIVNRELATSLPTADLKHLCSFVPTTSSLNLTIKFTTNGSPLGPLLAEIFMPKLESGHSSRQYKPSTYATSMWVTSFMYSTPRRELINWWIILAGPTEM